MATSGRGVLETRHLRQRPALPRPGLLRQGCDYFVSGGTETARTIVPGPAAPDQTNFTLPVLVGEGLNKMTEIPAPYNGKPTGLPEPKCERCEADARKYHRGDRRHEPWDKTCPFKNVE